MKGVLDALVAAPEYINPAIERAAEVMQLEAKGYYEDAARLLRSVEVERAIDSGEREAAAVQRALAACGHTPPVPSKTVPLGF